MNKEPEEDIREKKMFEILDPNGISIKNITAIVTYKDGIVVGTPNGLYTNVESLINLNKK